MRCRDHLRQEDPCSTFYKSSLSAQLWTWCFKTMTWWWELKLAQQVDQCLARRKRPSHSRGSEWRAAALRTAPADWCRHHRPTWLTSAVRSSSPFLAQETWEQKCQMIFISLKDLPGHKFLAQSLQVCAQQFILPLPDQCGLVPERVALQKCLRKDLMGPLISFKSMTFEFPASRSCSFSLPSARGGRWNRTLCAMSVKLCNHSRELYLNKTALP